jgi:phosphoglycerol transferase MdoB-like AlkP superfamily enzyme
MLDAAARAYRVLPGGSIPYRQYVRGPIPALARTLRDLGYATVAVQADPKYYYDRERVYPLLGFDRACGSTRRRSRKPIVAGGRRTTWSSTP